MGLIFNVTDYGACAGAAELQTKYIQAAIDACFAAGGGEVVVPAGVFRTATIRLRSHITLHLLSGADFVKLFPVGVLGVSYVKAIRAPLSHARMLAVGGVNENNAADFIRAGCVGIGVGGNLVNADWITAGAFDRIEALAKAYVDAVNV